MTPWAGNLISSSQTKASPTPYQNRLNHRLIGYMKVKKKIKGLGKKIGGKGL
jgi:hypothetical protein